jgi:cell division protease FtsH
MFLPKEDRHTMTKRQTLARIAMALGGRAAEKIVFNEVTSGASDDIKRATSLARAMICELGMSEKLGPISYSESEGNVFLGREMGQRSVNYSEETAREIDRELRELIDTQYLLAVRVLEENRDKLDRLAYSLLERETLDSEEIQAAFDGRELPARQRVVIPTYADQRKEQKEKKRPASIFGAPKPAAST